MLRPICLATLLLLANCTPMWPLPFVAGGAADLVSVTVFHRDMFDIVWSGITGKNCSIVRLDRGESYCRPIEPPPPIPPYCTRSIGTVDCWTSAAVLPDPPNGLADGPGTLTPEQQANKLSHWRSPYPTSVLSGQ
jgi:hypothetical protein